MKKHLHVVLNLFILFNIQIVFAQKTYDVTNLNSYVNLTNQHMEILSDSTGKVDSVNVLSSKLFNPLNSTNNVSSNTTNSYWMRFRLKSNIHKTLFFELSDLHLNKVTIYKLSDNGLSKIGPTSGFGLYFKFKEFYYKNFLFTLEITPDSSHTYYIHCNTKGINSFSNKLSKPQKFVEYSLTEYYLLGFYYGVLCLMAIYNLIIYIRVKERVYLFYVSYVVFCALNSFTEDGLGFQYIWPNFPQINVFLFYWIPDLLLISFMVYSASFLNLYTYYRRSMLVVLALVVIHITITFANIFIFNHAIQFGILYLLPFILIFWLGIRSVLNGNRYAKYYVTGYSFIIFSFIIFYLRIKGINFLPHLITIYSFNFGFLLEVIVLSFALGERLRSEKTEKELAQLNTIAQLEENEKIRKEYTETLELQVKQRTIELQKANEEIQLFNNFLKEKNLKLETDVKIISQERVSSKLMTLEEFKSIYETEDACKNYLFNKKWSDKVFCCSKCGHDKDLPHEPFTKRCAKCKYVESSTANTIFHGVKIPLPEAFYILYAVFTQKNVTAEELSKVTFVSERSCSVFKKKIQESEVQIKAKQKKLGWESIILIKN